LYPHCGITLWLLLGRATGRTRGPRLDRLVIALLSSFVLTAILYVPTLLRVGFEAVVRNQFVRPRPRAEVVGELPALLVETWWQWNESIPPALAIAFVAAWAVALIVTTRGRGGVWRLSGL